MDKKSTSVDAIIEQIKARKTILEDNPRSIELLAIALEKATKLARLERRRNEEFEKEYRIVLVHDQE